MGKPQIVVSLEMLWLCDRERSRSPVIAAAELSIGYPGRSGAEQDNISASD